MQCNKMSSLLIKLWLAVNQWQLAVNISSPNPPQPKRSVHGLMTPHNLKAIHACNIPETYLGFHISHSLHFSTYKTWHEGAKWSADIQQALMIDSDDEWTNARVSERWSHDEAKTQRMNHFPLQVTRPVAAVHAAGVVHSSLWSHGGQNVFLVIRWWEWRLEREGDSTVIVRCDKNCLMLTEILLLLFLNLHEMHIWPKSLQYFLQEDQWQGFRRHSARSNKLGIY